MRGSSARSLRISSMSAGVRWYFFGLIGRIIGGRDGLAAAAAAATAPGELSLVAQLLLSEEEEELRSDGCGLDGVGSVLVA